MPIRLGRLGKRARRLLFLAGGVLGALLLAEGALRFVLLSDLARSSGFGWQLRHPELYSSYQSGRLNWKLRALFDPGAGRPSPAFDARVGWLRSAIDPATLAHEDEGSLAARTPVLLFGDSYAQCAEEGSCWQRWLEASPLAARYRLLNYGVGGYGLDQILLLLRLVLEHFGARQPAPVVVIGILVDDDLDRPYLGLRNYPKPTFAIEDGELVLHPLEQSDSLSYVSAHPLGVRSFLWRWLLFGTGLFSSETAIARTDEADHVAVKEALGRSLVREIERELVARDVPHFYLLFHAHDALVAPGPYGWQEPLLYRELEQLHASFVSSKRFLRAYLARPGTHEDDLFIRAGQGKNHYTAAANALVFEALREGLEGHFEPYEYLAER